MKFATVTLNPAIDKQLQIRGHMKAGELNVAGSAVVSGGGKGINVARALTMLGADVTAYSLLGEKNNGQIMDIYNTFGIAHKEVLTASPVRENIKMIDDYGLCTEVNSRGERTNPADLKKIIDMVAEDGAAGKYDVLILSGSIPPGVEDSVYARMIFAAKEYHIPVYLDASGEPLRIGAAEVPTMIKPNLHEFSTLCAKEFPDEQSVLRQMQYVSGKIDLSILCTLGEEGSLYVGGGASYRVTAPKVDVCGFAGAGDTFLAGFLYALYCEHNGKCTPGSLIDALQLASSAAAAKVATPGTNIPDGASLRRFRHEVGVTEI